MRQRICPDTIRFPGQYFDAETGLHYNRFRYYDPGVGRYVSADPIGQDGGVNVYEYARNQPARFMDPLGLFGLGVAIGGSAQVGLGDSQAATTGSAGFVLFDNGVGSVFASGGSFDNDEGGDEPTSFPSGPREEPTAGGLFAGGGASLVFTTADCASEFQGSGELFDFNFGAGFRGLSVQVSTSPGGDVTVSVSVPVGGGVGLGVSKSNSFTSASTPSDFQ